MFDSNVKLWYNHIIATATILTKECDDLMPQAAAGKNDFSKGAVWKNILSLSIPLTVAQLVQLCYNIVDRIYIGHLPGASSLALTGLGLTFPIITVITAFTNLFGSGGAPLCSIARGEGNEERAKRIMGNSFLMLVATGVVLMVLCEVFKKPVLYLFGASDDTYPYAAAYLSVYLLGTIFVMIGVGMNNFISAQGFGKTSMLTVLVGAVINIVLDPVFIFLLDMGVQGAAIATVISQAISAVLIVISLMKSDGPCRLDLKKLRIHRPELLKMAQIGLPAGFQGAIFSVSNVLIQSSINSFGSTAMAGSTAAANIEGFVYTAMNTFHHTTVNFTSQNLGAHKFDRIKKSILLNLILVTIVGLVLGGGAYLLGPQLLRIYNDDPHVISYGMIRIFYICVPYFLCGIMDTFVGGIRGMGVSVIPMITSLIGACGLRILWIYTVFQWNCTLPVLFLSYPVTWLITALAHMICCIIIYRRTVKHATATAL